MMHPFSPIVYFTDTGYGMSDHEAEPPWVNVRWCPLPLGVLGASWQVVEVVGHLGDEVLPRQEFHHAAIVTAG